MPLSRTSGPAARGLVLIALAALGLGTASAAGATPMAAPVRPAAPAAAVVEPGVHTIRALHSGKCLAPQGDSTADDVLIVQQTCDGRPSQRVTVQRIHDQDQKPHLRFVTDAGKCWNVERNKWNPWARITQYRCQNRPNEVFDLLTYHPWSGSQITPTFNPNVLCLHTYDATTADGAHIIQLACNPPGSGDRNDTFTFVPA
ncbi:RICIN domain-containing protein [Streptomyces sp. NPDC051567]|uniref:RICIN domain-containing protein n=1 Tax=Streptomyces sp. NPDC051567 TaxID=3365660 RepID=UPI0037A3CDFE